MTLDTRRLKHFLAIVDADTLSAAAARIGITPSGLTRSLQGLEEQLGAQLFERSARGLTPSPLGRALERQARAILLGLADAERDIRGVILGESGRLVVGAGPSWLARILPQAVTRLRTRSAGATLSVIGGFNDRLMEGLADGRVDVVVAALDPGAFGDTVAFEVLTHDELGVLARTGHPATEAAPDLDLLAGADWVLPNSEVLSRRLFDAIWTREGRPSPAPAVESDSIAFILALVAASEMISFGTRQIARTTPGIAFAPWPGGGVSRPAGVAFRRNGANRLAQIFIEELRAICDSLDAN